MYWHDRVPEEIAEELAKALTQMTIDMPSAGLEFEVERWDVARLRKSEKDSLASGQQSFGLAAMHAPTGEVAAYTYI
ncbi:GNAT family N-acetyltransferase, partial [Vibrio vulnificus]